MNADLLTRLIAAGTPAELVAEVALVISKGQVAQAAIDSRRMNDRQRKAKQTGGNVNSREGTGIPGSNVNSGEEDPARDAPADEGAPADEITSKTTTKNITKTPPSEGQKPKRKPSPRTRILPDAQPNDADKRTAGEAGMATATFRHEWAKFRSKHLADGSLMADWSQAWRTWVLKWVEYGSKQIDQGGSYGVQVRTGVPPPVDFSDSMTNAADRYAARFQS